MCCILDRCVWVDGDVLDELLLWLLVGNSFRGSRGNNKAGRLGTAGEPNVFIKAGYNTSQLSHRDPMMTPMLPTQHR